MLRSLFSLIPLTTRAPIYNNPNHCSQPFKGLSQIQQCLMEITVESHHIASFSLLASWALFEFWRLRRLVVVSHERVFRGGKFTVIGGTVPWLSLLNSLIFLGFGVYGVLGLGLVSVGGFVQSGSWLLVSFLAFYCQEKVLRGNRRWPMVLVSWWVFSGLFQLFLMTVFISRHFQLVALPRLVPQSTAAELASCPSSLLLLVLSLSMNYSSVHQLRQPLLARSEEEEGSVLRENFSTAGVWSRLTFSWLNPVFQKGRTQRLELQHIPSVPQSETADAAYSTLLRESLDKQKPEFSPLLRAIVRAVWGPLVINAVFAGMQKKFHYFFLSFLFSFISCCHEFIYCVLLFRRQHAVILSGSFPDRKLCEFSIWRGR